MFSLQQQFNASILVCQCQFCLLCALLPLTAVGLPVQHVVPRREGIAVG